MAKLTARERKLRRFAQEYIEDFNGARAARAVGSKESRAKNDASMWLQDDFVKVELDRLMKEREEQSRVKAFKVLENLAPLIESSVDNYEVTDDGEFKVRKDAPEDAILAVASLKHRIVHEPGGKVVRTVEFRMHPKVDAQRLAFQHLGRLTENHKISDPEGNPLTFTLALGEGKPVGE